MCNYPLSIFKSYMLYLFILTFSKNGIPKFKMRKIRDDNVAELP